MACFRRRPSRHFNPRSRMGSDLHNPQDHQAGFRISIHAPAWGATTVHYLTSIINLLFQSTLPHGERPMRSKFSIELDEFQSTLPHGERLLDPLYGEAAIEFQSSLPHGERLRLAESPQPSPYFNPRSRMGSDGLSRQHCFLHRWHFNPRSRMGSDDTIAVHPAHLTSFQSTLPHGERPSSDDLRSRMIIFQSTLPHGERPASHLPGRFND